MCVCVRVCLCSALSPPNRMFKSDEPVNPDCFNEFRAFTGNNAEQWVVRVFGDQTVEVNLNGETIQERGSVGDAEGGVGFGTSPNSDIPHSIFELRFPASKGTFSTQLKDPGPGFGCNLVGFVVL